jgi:uncharacterized protein (TIGR03083 family)
MMPTKEELLIRLRCERSDLLDLLHSLSAPEWESPTQLKGWRVRDVVGHLHGNCSGEFDEAFRRARDGDPAPVIPGDLNAWNERQATFRRDWPIGRLLSEYERQSYDLLSLIERWDSPIDMPVRLAESIQPRPFWLEVRILGVHHWAHGQDIRQAVDRPGGVTDERMRPVVQAYFDMAPLVFRAGKAGRQELNVAFELSGPGGGRWLIEIAKGRCTTREDAEKRADVTLRGTTWDFYRVGQGLISPQRAIMTLKLRPIGNPLAALRFARLFRTGKSAVDRPAPTTA